MKTVLACCLFATIAMPARAATITVTTEDDTMANDAQCSLREAITAANTDVAFAGCAAGSGTDVVVLPAGDYRLEIDGVDEDSNVTGDLDIRSSMTIQGAGADQVRVRGDLVDRVFDIRPGVMSMPVVVTLDGLLIRNGGASTGGSIWIGAGAEVLVLSSAVVNSVADFGAAIASQGALEVRNSVFHANSAVSGGAIWTAPNSTTMLRNVTFDANTSTQSGSALSFNAPATLNNVTISQNIADSDLDDIGDGAIEANAIVTISNTIVARNIDLSLGGSALLNPDCVSNGAGALVSRGHNLIGNAGTTRAGGVPACTIDATASDQIGNPLLAINPRLQPFGMYGGPVETYPPLPNSPAVERGSDAAAGAQGACEITDARGVLRPQGSRCDIGAVELEEIIFRDGFEVVFP